MKDIERAAEQATMKADNDYDVGWDTVPMVRDLIGSATHVAVFAALKDASR